MSAQMTTQEYKRAEFELTVAEEKRGFKIHALIYSIVMTGLIALNVLLFAFTDGDFPWAVFPLVGWGIGLTFHYFAAFRHEGDEIRAHQEAVEQYARRPKIPA